jgi:hypothetical protein
LKGNELKIGTDGSVVQIIATLDKEGLKKLREKIDNLIAILD